MVTQKISSHQKDMQEIRQILKELGQYLKEMARQNDFGQYLKEMARKNDQYIKEMARQNDLKSKENNQYLKEMARQNDLKSKENSQYLKEMARKNDQYIKEMTRQTDIRIEKNDRQIQKIGGRFNQRWGAFVESLVEGNLVKIFQNFGIDITQTHTRSQSEWRKSEDHVERREFDIIVANGKEVVVVEVKTTLNSTDVDEFLDTLKDFKKYFPRYRTEIVYGAVAYLSSENKAHLFAEKKGLFLIKATGDSAGLANKKGFKPRVFS